MFRFYLWYDINFVIPLFYNFRKYIKQKELLSLFHQPILRQERKRVLYMYRKKTIHTTDINIFF